MRWRGFPAAVVPATLTALIALGASAPAAATAAGSTGSTGSTASAGSAASAPAAPPAAPGAAAAPIETRDAATFAAWRAQNEPAVAAFEAYLASAGVAGVVALHELLRSASAWQACGDEPYAVPPAAQWPAAARVLQLLKALQAAGTVGPVVVHSTYRNPRLNACAGGAAGSAHLRSYAIDFTPLGADDPTAALCTFWRSAGRDWAMGLSRYPSGRIHIDTAGHRTWGADHSGRSAVCGG